MKKRKVLAYLFASLLFSTALFSCGNKKPDNYNEEIYRIYELAKEDGYQGTYEEWLDSIKGEKGETGPQGDKGDPGTPGKDGEDGLTPVITIGSNGNWFIDGVDTGVKAQGDKGDTGSQGEKGDKGDSGTPGKDGEDGEDGHTPEITIGENGNWYVDGVDTGVKAQGEKGETGPQGDKGDSGIDGTSLLTGNGRPTNDKGINGDSFIDLSSWDFYIKVNDKWTLKGNIKGDSTGEAPIYNTEGLVFTAISDTECSVSIGKGKERFLKEIYIPSTYEDYVVTKIEDGVDMSTGEIVSGFAGLSCLEKVYIPNTINYIGIGSFAFCNNLKEVVFEEGIEIDSLNNAFIYCSNLPHLEIPEGVTKLNDAEFYGCDLSSLIIPSSIESVGYSAISSYQLYRSIYYRGTIEDWLNIEFDPGCLTGEDGMLSMYLLNEDSEWELLNEVVIPENITEANLYSFAYFYGVSDIEIHKDVKTIYSSNNQFQNIYFNGTLEDWLNVERSNKLGSNLYLLDDNGDVEHNGKKYSLFNPTELIIPDGITSISAGAFANMTSLKKVTIPSTVITIGYGAFRGCDSLEEITIPFVGEKADGSGATHFGYIFGASDDYYNEQFVPTSLKEVIITDGSCIGEYSFYKCSSLTTVKLPNSVNCIGGAAFCRCSSLTNIIIPDSVTSIGYSAFEDCYSLKNVIIPDSVTSIGAGAFYECSSITSVTIPNSVTTIGENTFYNCSSLTSVTIPDSVTSIGNSSFSYCISLASVTIPNSVTTIGENAFYYCSSLTSVTIPDSVTSIGNSAFDYCSSIEKANIPTNAISYIPNNNLKEVIINSGTTIGYNAFYNCSSLTSVTIPNSVTSIGTQAFYGCSSLENIYYNGTLADWCKINFGNQYSNPMYAANNGCLYFLDENGDVDYNGNKYTLQTSLLVITEEISEIKQYAFYGCDILEIHYDGFESDFNNIIYNGYLGNVFDNSSNITVYALNTIKQVRSEVNYNKLYNIKGIVIENYSVGYVVYDGTGFITVYLNDASPYEVGEYLHIKGYISTYANSPQFTSNAVVSILDESVPEYINIENEPDLTINAEYISNVMWSWKYNSKQPGGVYGTLEGTLTKGTYYTLSTDSLTVSLSPLTPTQEDAELYDQYLGKKVYCEVVLMHVINDTAIQVVILSINLVDEGEEVTPESI